MIIAVWGNSVQAGDVRREGNASLTERTALLCPADTPYSRAPMVPRACNGTCCGALLRMPIIAWKPGDRKCGDSRTPEQVLPPPSPSAASVVAQVYPPLWTRRSPRNERDLDDQAECTAAAGLNSQNPNQSPERGGKHGVPPFILLMRVAQGRMTRP